MLIPLIAAIQTGCGSTEGAGAVSNEETCWPPEPLYRTEKLCASEADETLDGVRTFDWDSNEWLKAEVVIEVVISGALETTPN